MCSFVWLYDLCFWIFFFLKCYTSLTCSNCTVQYTTIWGLGKWLLFGCNVCLTSLRSFSFPPSSSQWVSMWPSLMYFVTKSGFLLGDSYWWVSNYELMVYYVKIHFELKKDLLLHSMLVVFVDVEFMYKYYYLIYKHLLPHKSNRQS